MWDHFENAQGGTESDMTGAPAVGFEEDPIPALAGVLPWWAVGLGVPFSSFCKRQAPARGTLCVYLVMRSPKLVFGLASLAFKPASPTVGVT